MKKKRIQIDEDTYNALIAFAFLNDTDSLDLCLAIVMRDATLGQCAEEFYDVAESLCAKKRKEYGIIDK